MRDPLYLRGSVWWCRIRGPSGRIERKSTKCRDKQAAKLRWRELERDALSPTHHAKDQTLADALGARLDERRSAGRAKGTLSMYTVKGKQLARVLGAETPVSQIDGAAVDRYVAVRLREGAKRTTIQKELVVLRGTLKLAKRNGFAARAVDEVMPLDFSAKYKPKERALSELEIDKLLGELPAPRAALVAFLLGTGATYPSEVENLRKADIGETFVLLRGTKRETRHRKVPILSLTRKWIARAKPYAPFERWSNIRRDLHQACDRAGIARCSPNDLRRTLATLLRARGAEPSLLAPLLGHRDSRMVERVYGRLQPEELRKLLDARTKSARSA